MNIRETLLKENSKTNVLAVAAYIGTNQQHFKELLALFLEDDVKMIQRSAHAISEVADKQPKIVQAHIHTLVSRMLQPNLPVAVKRNVVRVLQYLEIPEDLHGDVMNSCFDFLADPKETIAVRAFSMTVLGNLAMIYPDIKSELQALIEDALEHEPTPGIRSRGLKILNRLK